MKGQRGWVRGLATAVALALLAGPALGQAVKPAAMVNGEPITLAEVDAILTGHPTPTPLTTAQRQELRHAVLEDLISEMLMQQFLRRELAGKVSPGADSPEVNQQLGELVASLKQKNMTLAQFLKESGLTEKQLRDNVVKKLLWEAYVTQHLTDADVKRYYDAYKPFFDSVTVKASHILLKLPEGAKDTDRQVARNKLRALRQEIVSGKIDFADAAKKYSECPSRTEGGDIGFFPRKFKLQEPFARAAFALQVGEVSDVVETNYGLHLIKATDRSPGQPSDFEKIKEDVRKFYMMEMASLIVAREQQAARIVINLP